MPTLLFFEDLRKMRLVENHTTLNRWIKTQGFPRGRLLGPRRRVWLQDEIDAWVMSRPTGESELRGGAKMRRLGQPLKKAKRKTASRA